MKKVIFGLALAMGLTYVAGAQEDKENVNKYLDFNYEKKGVVERKVVPYPGLREADVIYAKRVHRVIDTREKKNMVMAWPKNPLNKVFYVLSTTGEPTSTGKLKAYRADSLSSALTIAEVKKIGGFCETVQVPYDESDPYYTYDTTVCTDFDYNSIVRYQIAEEWIFDKQRGMFFPRIIAIAPMFVPNVSGVPLPEQPMFWLSWEELRPILIHEEVFNPQNDAMRLTYYDFFELRLFSSYITKESNIYDQEIRQMVQYKDDPLEALYESDRVKEEMFNWEHDLWEY